MKQTKEQELATQIGQFYLNKNNGDYAKAESEVVKLGVTNLVCDQDDSGVWLEVHLSRPGLLIGPRGKNVDELEKFLKVKIKIFETDHWNNWLVPRGDWG